MAKTSHKTVLLERRRKRVRKHISGTAARPRVSVYRSLKHVYAQIIDDKAGCTLVAASSVVLKIPGGNVKAATEVGKALAERAKEKGITRVSFDRGGRMYHGRVKALADAAREAGLEF